MTEAGYDGLIAMNTTLGDLADSMTEQSSGQYTFTEQKLKNCIHDYKSQQMIVDIRC